MCPLTYSARPGTPSSNFSHCSRSCYRHWENFGPLPDRRTGNHMENLSFTGPPKLLQDLIFFYIRIPIEGLPTGNFLPDRRTGAMRVFISPPLFSPVEDRGPVDFPMSAVILAVSIYIVIHIEWFRLYQTCFRWQSFLAAMTRLICHIL